MNTCIYLRHVTQLEAEKTAPTTAIVLAARAYWEATVNQGGLHYFCDELDQRKIHLCRRPEAKRMQKILEPGDHVIFPCLLRCFFTVCDAEDSINWCLKRSVHPHVLLGDKGYQLDGQGSDVWRTLASCGQWQRIWCTAAGLKQPRRRKLPLGFRLENQVIIEDHDERRIMGWLYDLHYHEGLSYAKIAKQLKTKNIWKDARKKIPWLTTTIKHWITAEKRLRQKEKSCTAEKYPLTGIPTER